MNRNKVDRDCLRCVNKLKHDKYHTIMAFHFTLNVKCVSVTCCFEIWEALQLIVVCI